MDDREFIDNIYQHWTKTTGAEERYWMPEKDDDGDYVIVAVDKEQVQTVVALGLSEADADFITAIHGASPDLTRRLHDALDEADRADKDRDDREAEIARLELSTGELSRNLEEEQATSKSLREGLVEARDELRKLKRNHAARGEMYNLRLSDLRNANATIESLRNSYADLEAELQSTKADLDIQVAYSKRLESELE